MQAVSTTLYCAEYDKLNVLEKTSVNIENLSRDDSLGALCHRFDRTWQKKEHMVSESYT